MLGHIKLLWLCEAPVSSAEDGKEHLHPAGQIKALLGFKWPSLICVAHMMFIHMAGVIFYPGWLKNGPCGREGDREIAASAIIRMFVTYLVQFSIPKLSFWSEWFPLLEMNMEFGGRSLCVLIPSLVTLFYSISYTVHSKTCQRTLAQVQEFWDPFMFRVTYRIEKNLHWSSIIKNIEAWAIISSREIEVSLKRPRNTAPLAQCPMEYFLHSHIKLIVVHIIMIPYIWSHGHGKTEILGKS